MELKKQYRDKLSVKCTTVLLSEENIQKAKQFDPNLSKAIEEICSKEKLLSYDTKTKSETKKKKISLSFSEPFYELLKKTGNMSACIDNILAKL